MSSVEEIRAGIMRSNEKSSESIAALQQAVHSLEEAQQLLMQATSGSGDQEIGRAHGLFAEALQGITGMLSLIQHAISSAESYSARL